VKKTHAQRQKELEARVTRLQGKLKQLQAALKVMVEAAQKKSGVDKNTTEKAAASKYEKKNSDPTSKYEKKTQKQKDAAADAAQKYRDNNKVLEDQVNDLNDKIKSIRDRIKRMHKTGSVGVSTHNT
jgi:DNA repair exonuclease SbcCD ATPase subunit